MGLRGHDEYDGSESADWGDYIIDRRETGNFLLNTFKESDGPLSIRINASYGSGKTIFMRCLKKQAESDGFIVIYYNAWEEETSLDARSSLCLAILEKIELYLTEEKVNSKVLALQKAILPIVAKAGIAALSRFLLGDHKALLETFESVDLGNTIANALRGGLDEAQKSRSQISGIKKSLSELVSSLGNKKFLILIDELDRCRPDFAIEVLETIKHFFPIRNIFSIVGVHEKVLYSIIYKRYGSDIGAESYLQRHFNHKMTFSRFDYEKYLLDRLQKTDAFGKGWLINGDSFNSGIHCAAKYGAQICARGDLNLRQINQLINKIDLIITEKCVASKNLNKAKIHVNLFSLLLACFIKEIDIKNYFTLLNREDNETFRLAILFLIENLKHENFIAYLLSSLSRDETEFAEVCRIFSKTYEQRTMEFRMDTSNLFGTFKAADRELNSFDDVVAVTK